MKAKVPLKPSKSETLFSWIYTLLCFFLWLLLVLGSIHLLSYYYFISTKEGFSALKALRFARI